MASFYDLTAKKLDGTEVSYFLLFSIEFWFFFNKGGSGSG